MPDMDDQGKRIMTGPHGVDRRALRRNRVLKSALAAYNSQFTTMPCVMRNVSEDGARLEFDELARVPASFVLHVGIDGYQIGCERVWRDGKACGVKFTGEKSPSHFFHPQALGMSQAALDRHVARALQLHHDAGDTQDALPAIVELRRRPQHKKRTFGRRV